MKHVIKFGLFALVVMGMSVFLWQYLNGYLSRSKATAETVGLSFIPIPTPPSGFQGGSTITATLTVSSQNVLSGVDISFIQGTNLNFLYNETVAAMPSVFDVSVLDSNHMSTPRPDGTRSLLRLVYVSKRKTANLPGGSGTTINIPLKFQVVAGATDVQATIAVDTTKSTVVGATPLTFGTSTTPPSFSIPVSSDPRAASATNLVCEPICNVSARLKWTSSVNGDGYKIYKNGLLVDTLLGKNITVYDRPCTDHNSYTYTVVAYNGSGSVSTTVPVVDCACPVCPQSVLSVPTPTPIPPTNSADLMFKLKFPDAAPTVTQIPNVKITVFDVSGKHICKNDTNCVQIVTFTRIGSSNYFASPQIQFDKSQLDSTINRPYSIVVKQEHTLQRTYNYVFLKWQKIVSCYGSNSQSGCGQLISEIDKRPMYSGDLERFNTTADGYNIINFDDLVAVGNFVDEQKLSPGSKLTDGDMNFDGSTDDKDNIVMVRNLKKKGD